MVVLTEKLRTIRDDVFFCPWVDTETGKYKLFIQKINLETNEVELEDSIDINLDEFNDVQIDDGANKELLGKTLFIRSSQSPREIDLTPVEKYKVLKSWAVGFAKERKDDSSIDTWVQFNSPSRDDLEIIKTTIKESNDQRSPKIRIIEDIKRQKADSKYLSVIEEVISSILKINPDIDSVLLTDSTEIIYKSERWESFVGVDKLINTWKSEINNLKVLGNEHYVKDRIQELIFQGNEFYIRDISVKHLICVPKGHNNGFLMGLKRKIDSGDIFILLKTKNNDLKTDINMLVIMDALKKIAIELPTSTCVDDPDTPQKKIKEFNDQKSLRTWVMEDIKRGTQSQIESLEKYKKIPEKRDKSTMTILTEKFRFIRDDIFLCPWIDVRTGKQKLVMQKINMETNEVEYEKSLKCIDVVDLSYIDERDEVWDDENWLIDLKEQCEVVYTAFKSWVVNIADSGSEVATDSKSFNYTIKKPYNYTFKNGFKIQSKIENIDEIERLDNFILSFMFSVESSRI